MLNFADYLAVGRLSKERAEPYRVNIQSRGDALRLFSPPCQAVIYYPSSSHKDDIEPSISGLKPDGTLEQCYLLRIGGDARWVELWKNEMQPYENYQDLKGAWVCISKDAVVEKNDGLYVFQLKGLEVFETQESDACGVIVDYFETGAHGILVAKLPDGEECMIPFVDEIVTYDADKKRLIVENFKDFLV